MSFEATINKILERYESLKKQMLESVGNSEDFVKLSKEFSNLEDFVGVIDKYNKAQKELSEVEETINDLEIDPDFKELVATEIENLKTSIPQLKKEIKSKQILGVQETFALTRQK